MTAHNRPQQIIKQWTDAGHNLADAHAVRHLIEGLSREDAAELAAAYVATIVAPVRKAPARK
jgi:hypothetical protein